jgi:hypothetical protein
VLVLAPRFTPTQLSDAGMPTQLESTRYGWCNVDGDIATANTMGLRRLVAWLEQESVMATWDDLARHVEVPEPTCEDMRLLGNMVAAMQEVTLRGRYPAVVGACVSMDASAFGVLHDALCTSSPVRIGVYHALPRCSLQYTCTREVVWTSLTSLTVVYDARSNAGQAAADEGYWCEDLRDAIDNMVCGYERVDDVRTCYFMQYGCMPHELAETFCDITRALDAISRRLDIGRISICSMDLTLFVAVPDARDVVCTMNV